MPKKYCFSFPGTRDAFAEILDRYPNYDRKFYRFNDYIVEVSDKTYRFGVARGSHSGGYWYEPTVTEEQDKIVFRGEIRYIDSHTDLKGFKKIIDKVGDACLFIFVIPFILVFKAYMGIRWLIRKILRRPTPKDETPADRLCSLMETVFGCTQQ